MADPASGYAAKGALLQIRTATSTTGNTWQTVSGLRRFNLEGARIDELDVTHTDSTANARVFVPTWIDYGSLSFSGLYDPGSTSQGTTGKGVIGVFQARSTEEWRIDVNGSTVEYVRFAGWVQNHSLDWDFEGPQAFDGSVRLTREVNYDATSTE